MRNLIIVLCGFLVLQSAAQTEYIEVDSKILKQTRQIKVQLPRNYKANEDKSYPVILVFDGDYLFEPVAGLIDYYSYWEYIPEAIVIGVNQAGYRKEDGLINPESELPVETGALFYDFITLEVLEFAAKNYRTLPFWVITAQDFMANYASFFLMKDNPEFRGYINLSPDYSPQKIDRLKAVFESTDQKLWYYMSTAENDISQLRESIRTANAQFKNIENDNFFFYYNDFKKEDHHSHAGLGLSFAFQDIFSPYKPISEIEFNSKVLKADHYVDYLIEKYNNIAELYDLEVNMRESDFLYIHDAIEENEKWEQFKDLSQVAKKELPETLFSDYFLGRYYEEIGKPKKAMKTYRGGYGLREIGFITNDLMIQKADRLKEIFGY